MSSQEPAQAETPIGVEEGEAQTISHEATLFAEPIFQIGSFTVTNALLNSWIALLAIIVFGIAVRSRLRRIPRGVQNYLEVLYEGALSLADSVTNSREKSEKFLPFVLPFFVFVLLNNWLGILPGVGTIGFIETHGGEATFVPLLRGATADLNTTLALAIVAVIGTHIFGIFMTRASDHLNRFFNYRALTSIPRKVFKERQYTALLVNPIEFFVGIVEFIGEVAKIASLSFRLFGNVFAGEVLLGAMAAIFAYVLPIPFIFLELLVGVIQALIFAMLTLVFLTIMATSHEQTAEGHT